MKGEAEAQKERDDLLQLASHRHRGTELGLESRLPSILNFLMEGFALLPDSRINRPTFRKHLLALCMQVLY
jgi:hypothetical protein